MSKNTRTRILLTAVAALLLVTMAVGGTIAYLQAATTQIVNTFEDSDLGVTLEETDYTYEMVPGHTAIKDPKAAIVAGSEDAYLFVTVTEANNILDKTSSDTTNANKYVQYDVDTDVWTAVPNNPGVFYKVVTDNAIGTEYAILKGNTVTYNPAITKAQMDAVTTATYPTLSFKAYAFQYYKTNDVPFGVEEAWNLVTK